MTGQRAPAVTVIGTSVFLLGWGGVALMLTEERPQPMRLALDAASTLRVHYSAARTWRVRSYLA